MPTALPPRRRRRLKWQSSASDRGPSGRGGCGASQLGHLQHQVPVLGALEAGIEATDLVDQRASQNAQVTGVHLRPHPLRRPVRLEEGAGVEAAFVDLVLVGVDVVGVRGGVDRLADLGECVGMEQIVVVEEDDEIAPRPSPGRRWRRRLCRRSVRDRRSGSGGRRPPRHRGSGGRGGRPSRHRPGSAPRRRNSGSPPTQHLAQHLRRRLIDWG